MTIAKVDAADSTTPIPGTTFTIEGIDSDYRNDVTTSEDGTVSLRVAPGSYKVIEQSVPAPYLFAGQGRGPGADGQPERWG